MLHSGFPKVRQPATAVIRRTENGVPKLYLGTVQAQWLPAAEIESYQGSYLDLAIPGK